MKDSPIILHHVDLLNALNAIDTELLEAVLWDKSLDPTSANSTLDIYVHTIDSPEPFYHLSQSCELSSSFFLTSPSPLCGHSEVFEACLD